MCKQIDHFPEDTDYEADPSEYFLREYQSCQDAHREIKGVSTTKWSIKDRHWSIKAIKDRDASTRIKAILVDNDLR